MRTALTPGSVLKTRDTVCSPSPDVPSSRSSSTIDAAAAADSVASRWRGRDAGASARDGAAAAAAGAAAAVIVGTPGPPDPSPGGGDPADGPTSSTWGTICTGLSPTSQPSVPWEKSLL